ncbi:hypothetical protein BDQ94DRAFT_142548, partial [Aspergillus welwitschiae]
MPNHYITRSPTVTQQHSNNPISQLHCLANQLLNSTGNSGLLSMFRARKMQAPFMLTIHCSIQTPSF